MRDTINYIRTTLNGLYEPWEIENFIAIIFREVCGYNKADLILCKNNELSEPLVSQIRRFTLRLKAYEPIQYIIGKTFFHEFCFNVAPGVLIPRPETEELVDLIHRENSSQKGTLLDIGTGSGCIAVSLARLLPSFTVHAWDISPEALTIAKGNAKVNNADVIFKLQDILIADSEDIDNKFDIIVSNPPYICEKEKAEMKNNVLDHEPHIALFVDDSDPLLFYRTIAEFGLKALNPSGKLYFEINREYGIQTKEMLESLHYQDVRIIRDMQGNDRIVTATFNI